MLRSFTACVFLLVFSLPGLARAKHAYSGHTEIRCNSDFSNHYHQTEFDCQFHKYFSTFSVLPIPEVPEIFKVPTQDAEVPSYVSATSETNWKLRRLRGPPMAA